MAPASKNKKRLDILQNQIHPEVKTESTKYFGLVNQENILSKRNETVKIRQVFSNISNLFQEIYLLLEKEDEIIEKSDWWDQMKKVKKMKKN
jgi:transcription termination factor Rho